MSEPASMTDAVVSVNDQVTDSVAQLQHSLDGLAQPFAAAAAYQAVAHTLGLALQNAVARQQHSHILRTALTTAAAAAILDGRVDQAQAVLKLAESSLANPSFETEVAQLQVALAGLRAELDKTLASAGAATAAASASPASNPVEAAAG